MRNKFPVHAIRIATAILSQTMLEQRHKMSMHQLEHEMQVEMHKQRELLNQELEVELQLELEVSQSTLTRIQHRNNCRCILTVVSGVLLEIR